MNTSKDCCKPFVITRDNDMITKFSKRCLGNVGKPGGAEAAAADAAAETQHWGAVNVSV